MKKKSTMAWISEFIAPYRFHYIASVLLAFASVICSFLPYFYIGQIIRDLFNGVKDGQLYLQACLWMAVFWLAYAIFHALSTALSHRATFVVLADIRFRLTEKLAKIPLGSVLAQSSGSYKNIIVERVDEAETTLAHIIPEFTASLFGPLIVLIYMIRLDWRLTLLSLLTLPIGILFYANMLRKSKGDFENTVVKTKILNDTAVEYINGIEVIKVFGKEKFSYQKFVTAAKEGADCFIEWMRKCRFDMAAVSVIMPSVLSILLPVGAYFVYNGSLSQDNFILLMILSMGLLTPLITLGTYMDDIRKVGTIFGEITEILERPDLQRPQDIEGLIHITNLPEFYQFNERTLSLQGEKSGKVFRVGQSIKVKVVRADKETGDIDFDYLPSDFDVIEKFSHSQKNKPRPSRRGGDSKTKASKRSKQSALSQKKKKKPFYKEAVKKGGKHGKGSRKRHRSK